MESRFVLTGKPLEPQEVHAAEQEGLLLDRGTEEPFRAKARHVMKGFSESGSSEIEAIYDTTSYQRRSFDGDTIGGELRMDTGLLGLYECIYGRRPHTEDDLRSSTKRRNSRHATRTIDEA